MPADCKVARSPSRSLARLGELPATSVLLLFTPVMVPSGFLKYEGIDAKPLEVAKARTEKIETDPFELLGKALSKHHRRIRHVPYVPSVGFTETHDAFTTQADGIIVVTCEPETAVDKKDGFSMDAVLAKQAEFAENVASALEDAERSVPMANFHFGDDQWRHDVTQYKNIWVGEEYSAESVTQIVQLLFGHKEVMGVDLLQRH